MDLLDGMKTFVAAVETGSFTAAADRVGISKKLVSKYVAQLEQHLGVRLLHRTTRKLSLSDTGQRYYTRCAELIEDIAALEGSVRRDGSALTGTLRLAAPLTFGELYVQPLVRCFRRDHPGLTVDLHLNDRYIDLADEGYDLALRIGTLDDSALVARKLTQTELWAVASPDYLRSCPDLRSPRDLSQHSCVRDTNMRSGSAWPFTVEGQLRKFAVDSKLLVNSAKAVRDCVAAGEGIGLCPDYVVAPDVTAGRLVRVLTDYPSVSLDIHAIFLDARYMPAKVRSFLDYLAMRFCTSAGWEALLASAPGRGYRHGP